jgi:hypothetical protein
MTDKSTCDELAAALKGLHSDIEDLIGESHGVYGLHLNGDISPWGELVEGGRFERLTHLSAAREALSKYESDRAAAIRQGVS